MPEGPEGARLAKVCNAGWLACDRRSGLRPMAALKLSEAVSSVEAVRRHFQQHAGGMGFAGPGQASGRPLGAPGSGDTSYVDLGQGVTIILDQLRRISPPPGSPPPAEAIHRYYTAIAAALEAGAGPDGDATRLRELDRCCCGAALANLVRNLGSTPKGTAFRVISFDIAGIKAEGHLASVSIRRTADFRLGTAITRSAAVDTLWLRLRPGGWSVYR